MGDWVSYSNYLVPIPQKGFLFKNPSYRVWMMWFYTESYDTYIPGMAKLWLTSRIMYSSWKYFGWILFFFNTTVNFFKMLDILGFYLTVRAPRVQLWLLSLYPTTTFAHTNKMSLHLLVPLKYLIFITCGSYLKQVWPPLVEFSTRFWNQKSFIASCGHLLI